MIAALVCSVALLVQAPQPVLLNRKFTLNEVSKYRVAARLQVEERQIGLQTFIPEDEEIIYNFTTTVKALKADGIVDLLYERPSIVVIEGETFESPPIRTEEKINQQVMLTVSPINEVLEFKDLNPQPTAPAKRVLPANYVYATTVQDDIGLALGALIPFIQDMTRLAVLVGGSFESTLDLAPRLPYDEVVPGDTWQRTVSFQPQKKEGQESTAVQRLDYNYTYVGLVDAGAKKVHRVTAEFTLDSDGADYVFNTYDIDRERAQLSKVPLKLSSKIEFDLDPVTMKTLRAEANAKGSFDIFLKILGDQPLIEVRISGNTSMLPTNP